MSKLTPPQVAAIENWMRVSARKISSGTTAQSLAEDFHRANALKETDPAKAAETEKALYALCGIATPPP